MDERDQELFRNVLALVAKKEALKVTSTRHMIVLRNIEVVREGVGNAMAQGPLVALLAALRELLGGCAPLRAKSFWATYHSFRTTELAAANQIPITYHTDLRHTTHTDTLAHISK